MLASTKGPQATHVEVAAAVCRATHSGPSQFKGLWAGKPTSGAQRKSVPALLALPTVSSWGMLHSYLPVPGRQSHYGQRALRFSA